MASGSPAGPTDTATAALRGADERDSELARLFAALAAAPREHDFFAVLRQVESLRPDQPRVGFALRPSQEALRLGQDGELAFAPAALESFDAGARPAPRLGVRFLGLLGPQGPMPLHFTEYVRERLRFRGDATLARFLDIFHHRLLALFYRAWAQAQPTVHHDRPGDDRFGAWLGAGYGAESGNAAARSVPETARLFQAGLLGARSRHPEGLSKLLRQYFHVPVRIEQHVANWMTLASEDRSKLGYSRSRAERSSSATPQLGLSATSGSKWRDRQYKFRLAIGPLTLAQYQDFLPGARTWLRLREWVQLYAGLDLLWDVELTLARAQVPEPRLGQAVRLGVTTWIGRVGAGRDRNDLRLRPDTSFLLRPGVQHA
ncbi:MAG: type VI secretion system baseplate subunit TssG [Pseudomonadota bacterium]|nr:type VI secretion system baseplate subunit TssG [Pseudomonadota bacterium]